MSSSNIFKVNGVSGIVKTNIFSSNTKSLGRSCVVSHRSRPGWSSASRHSGDDSLKYVYRTQKVFVVLDTENKKFVHEETDLLFHKNIN
jgi:hypothetical protein